MSLKYLFFTLISGYMDDDFFLSEDIIGLSNSSVGSSISSSSNSSSRRNSGISGRSKLVEISDPPGGYQSDNNLLPWRIVRRDVTYSIQKGLEKEGEEEGEGEEELR